MRIQSSLSNPGAGNSSFITGTQNAAKTLLYLHDATVHDVSDSGLHGMNMQGSTLKSEANLVLDTAALQITEKCHIPICGSSALFNNGFSINGAGVDNDNTRKMNSLTLITSSTQQRDLEVTRDSCGKWTSSSCALGQQRTTRPAGRSQSRLQSSLSLPPVHDMKRSSQLVAGDTATSGTIEAVAFDSSGIMSGVMVSRREIEVAEVAAPSDALDISLSTLHGIHSSTSTLQALGAPAQRFERSKIVSEIVDWVCRGYPRG